MLTDVERKTKYYLLFMKDKATPEKETLKHLCFVNTCPANNKKVDFLSRKVGQKSALCKLVCEKIIYFLLFLKERH